MASRIGTYQTVDGKTVTFLRKKQGRKPSGLAKPINVRLLQEDMNMIRILECKMGEYWNTNEFIRDAIHQKLSNSVYTELVKK